MKDVYALGYSGLDGYIRNKNDMIKGLSKHESFVGQGMDSAAALMCNGRIVAACAEERFTGNKHTGDFPKNAIDTCLKMAKIHIDDVTLIAHNFNYDPYEVLYQKSRYSEKLFSEILCENCQIRLFKKHYGIDVIDKFRSCDHHLCHASYVFETCEFDSSLVVVVDGMGEFSSISIYSGDKNSLSLIRSYGPNSSLGMLYSAITDYLGFITNSDEYKVMGLAAYGDKEVYRELFKEIIHLGENGNLIINNLIPTKIDDELDRETYRPFKKWLSTKIFPVRNSSDEVLKCHMDLAAALQNRLNEAMEHLVRYWQKQTDMTNLCISGGVALNCVTNAHIAEMNIFDNIYIAPASSDDGTSLGAAILSMKQNGIKLDKIHKRDMPFYGPDIDFNSLNQDLPNNLTSKTVNDETLINEIADAIVNEKIIAWTQGGMEFGPRALGHRSILADPRKYEMRDRLNVITKERENFRPFAPIVKEEYIDKYFEIKNGVSYKHMLVNVRVKNKYKTKLQAVTHIDGTARVQSVNKHDLPLLWSLLDKIEERTSMPILLNTSYNLKAMPIVCNENDAIMAFTNSDIDLLVINNRIIGKVRIDAEE